MRRFCARCPQCNRYQRSRPPRQGPPQVIPSGEPWERVSIDITGPHPRSHQGNVYILTTMDQFSKFVEAAPMPNQEAFVETVVVRIPFHCRFFRIKGKTLRAAFFQRCASCLERRKLGRPAIGPNAMEWWNDSIVH